MTLSEAPWKLGQAAVPQVHLIHCGHGMGLKFSVGACLWRVGLRGGAGQGGTVTSGRSGS